MNTQQTLFELLPDIQPVARNSDPDTSHQAADSIAAPSIRARHEAIMELLALIGDATDEYIATQYELLRNMQHWPRQSSSGLRTRRSELVTAGIIADSGRREHTISGRLAIVWTLVRHAE